MGKTLKIGEEEVTLRPLGVKYLPDLFALIGRFKDAKEEGDVIALLDEKTSTLLSKLVMATLKLSYPDEPQAELEAFAMNHLMEIMPVVLEINSFGATKDREVIKKVEHLRKMQDASAKDTGTPESA